MPACTALGAANAVESGDDVGKGGASFEPDDGGLATAPASPCPWKPAPGAYAYAAQQCGVEPIDMMLVAVHPWDIDGAHRAGLGTAWINRTGATYPDYFKTPTLQATSMRHLAQLLSQ